MFLLPSVCHFRSGKAHEQFISDAGGFICVNSKFISSEGAVRKFSLKNFCCARKGDVLMVMSDLPNGKALAKTFYVDEDNLYAVNQRVCAFTAYKDHPKYLQYKLNRAPYFLKFDDGVSQTHLLNNVFNKCPIAIPKSRLEQQAIAEALSDADGLIESLEKLIAKKRLIKQGAMQVLLTGKKRLPGFKGKWITKSLGELFDFSGGVSASRDQLSGDGICYLHYGDIHLSTKTFVDVDRDASSLPKLNISLNKVPPSALLKDGDIVFVDASEDNEGASKHVVVSNVASLPYISGLHTIVAKPKGEDTNPLFRRYCFQTEEIKRKFVFFAVGTKVTGVSKTNIAKIALTYPPTDDEQFAIASILRDMDSELSALEQKLAKARQIKQGMMQELLTGRIRLI
ncbi:MAG: restriction endonuclease subunit S [Alphaproteobacteria bacterium]|nr:restriction endonuclease subunit S [Alphaproteobacteria bacterium]